MQGRIEHVSGDLANLQSQFSLAYVQAVASAAGFFVQEASRGFDINGISMGRSHHHASWCPRHHTIAEARSPSEVPARGGDHRSFPHDLDVTAYNRLRVDAGQYQVPRVLVIVLVPDNISDWLLHSEDQLVLRRCGYWLSLRSAAATPNTTKIRVKIPRTNQLDVAGLTHLMTRVAAGDPL